MSFYFYYFLIKCILCGFRWYTKWFGCEGTASPELAGYALNNYTKWETQIEAWQNPILQSR